MGSMLPYIAAPLGSYGYGSLDVAIGHFLLDVAIISMAPIVDLP